MRISSWKENYKSMRIKQHEWSEILHAGSWQGDGSAVHIQTAFSGRKYRFEMSRNEAIELIEQLNRFILDGEK